MKYITRRNLFTIPLVLFVVLFISGPLFAQAASDPNHEFYVDAKRWEILGLTDTQPKQKPFPIFVIDDILSQVENSDNPAEAQLASSYRASIIDKPVNFFINTQYIPTTGSDKQIGKIQAGSFGDYYFSDYIGITWDLSGIFSNNKNHTRPLYTGLLNDTNNDSVTINSQITGYFNANNTFSFGVPDLYLITGISRVSLGSDVYDSLYLSGTGYHAPYATVYAKSGDVSFIQGIQCLTATNGFGNDVSGGSKFLSYHEIDWDILPWLSIDFFESCIYGQTFDFAYVLPSVYLITESFGAFEDNILMGVGAKVKPAQNLRVFADLYVDDIGSFAELAKLNFEQRLTFSGMLGAQYVPNSSVVKLLSGSYTLVTPWMYSHYDGDSTANYHNFQNYLHWGLENVPGTQTSKATQLYPNSHRLSFNSELTPCENLKISLGIAGFQHANISETLSDSEKVYYVSHSEKYITDGSLNQCGHTTDDYLNSYLYLFQFLEQDTIESTVQLNTDVEYKIKDMYGFDIYVYGSYLFEYIHNDGVRRNIYSYSSDTAGVEVANEQLAAWRSSITPHTINNYLTIGCRIVY